MTFDYAAMAAMHDLWTSDDVLEAERVGLLPGGSFEALVDTLPSESDVIFERALRDFLWIENEYITEEEMADSYYNAEVLYDRLESLSPEIQNNFADYLNAYD